ncbi:hypothetical protein HDU78_001371 [Chytriomyces hyalinus]|nr:hypothetical protein HDU78_001371 [Chytriomyces hyalinus]
MPNISRKPRIPTRSASLGKLHNVDKPLPDIPSPATLVDQDLPEQQHDLHANNDRNSHYARTYSLLIEYYYSSQTSRSMQTDEDDDDDTGSDMTTSDSESEYTDEAASRQSVVTDLYTVASSYHPKSHMSRSVWTADEATVETLELQDLDEDEFLNEKQVEQIVSQLRSRGLPVYEDSEDSESEYDDEYEEDDEDTDGMSFVASLTESTASIRQAEKVFGLMEKHGGVKLKSLMKDLIRWKHAKGA